MPNAPAARVSDNVKHSEAMDFRRVGGLIGGALGCVAGCVLVGAALATEVVTAGMATPLVAVAVYVGAGLVIAGSTASAASAMSTQGAHIGQKIPGEDEGPIVTGISSIIIGPDRQIAAYLGSQVSCKRHKHGSVSTMEKAENVARDMAGGLFQDALSVVTFGLAGHGRFSPAADAGQGMADAQQEHGGLEQIVQGSRTVRLGPGRFPAARVGDKGTCDFMVGHGCATVIIGGPTMTVGKIDQTGDDPEAASFSELGDVGGKALLAGLALLAVPVGFAAGGFWGAISEAGLEYKFQQAQGEAIGKIVNLLPNGQAKDTINSLMSVLPLLHMGGKVSSEGLRTGESTAPESTAPENAGSDNAGSNNGKSEIPDSKGDPTQPIGESPGGLHGGEEAVGDEEGSRKESTEEPETPPEDKIYRKDRAPDSAEGRTPGTRKSHFNEEGDLEPANPDGKATLQDHVHDEQPLKSDSPYTSFSDQFGTVKDYGGDQLTLDRGRLSQDIASGKVSGVEIVGHEGVLAAHDDYIADAQARYDADPTPKNLKGLEAAQVDRANSVRDREVLVKGTVPGEYVTRTPAEPPADTLPPDDAAVPSPDSDGTLTVDPAPPPTEPPPPDGPDGLGKDDGPDSRGLPPDEQAGDPLVQIGPRDGGMPGEAPAEQPGSTGQEAEEAPAAKADRVVQTGNVPGGEIGEEDEDNDEQPPIGDAAAPPDFTGKLRGQNVTLPGVKTEPLTYTKRAEADLADLRKRFGSTARFDPATKGMNPRPVAENRSNFLKGLANDPNKADALRTAGIDENGIDLMRQGKLPSKEWQVHHKLPLDDGGTNAPDNLILIENDPYHQAITNEQSTLTDNLKTGETLNIPNWPVPDGFVYPPIAPIAPTKP